MYKREFMVGGREIQGRADGPFPGPQYTGGERVSLSIEEARQLALGGQIVSIRDGVFREIEAVEGGLEYTTTDHITCYGPPGYQGPDAVWEEKRYPSRCFVALDGSQSSRGALKS